VSERARCSCRPQCVHGHDNAQRRLGADTHSFCWFADARSTGLTLVRLNVEIERLDTILVNKHALQLKILMLVLSAVFVVVQVAIQHYEEEWFSDSDNKNHTDK
jgi:hypothetical protein